MQTKTCAKCKRELSTSSFQGDKKRAFGVGSYCKDCKREYRQSNKDKLLIAQYKRVAEKKETLSPMCKAWNALHYAVKTNKIIKPDNCSMCGKEAKIQAHHRDYSKPFDVTWCCQDCHVELDKERRGVNYGQCKST